MASGLLGAILEHRRDRSRRRLDWYDAHMSTGVRVFSWTVFPVVLGGAVALTLWQMRLGVAPALAFLGPTLASYLLLWALERRVPYRRSWQRSRGDVPVDLGHLVVSGGITVELLRPLALMLAVALGGRLSQAFGAPLWPGGWPLLAQLLLALLVGEFFMYWAHRLGHVWEPLWRFHAVHHSAPRLYFLNAVRFHPVDLAISHYAPFVPLVALGADERVLALFALVSAVHGLFQHANVPIRCGPLNWFFSMAELHRWHHSQRLRESNTNYGQNLIVWDVLFGTRFLPADREPPEEIGIADMPDFPMDYLGQLLSPLRWRGLQRVPVREARQ
jgi:sterol desaturase/sphingolipid hydroxylase (fatty acid hydroxylase superfamily)